MISLVSHQMKVVDTERWAWFLFEHEGKLYIDANCSISAFGYSFMIELNDEECENYRKDGREYFPMIFIALFPLLKKRIRFTKEGMFQNSILNWRRKR